MSDPLGAVVKTADDRRFVGQSISCKALPFASQMIVDMSAMDQLRQTFGEIPSIGASGLSPTSGILNSREH